MAIISHNTVSRYQEAKLNLQSLFKQTYQVAFGLAMVLLITAGRPSPFGLTITVVLGIAFVSWSETKRLSSNRRNESIKRILKKMEEHDISYVNCAALMYTYIYNIFIITDLSSKFLITLCFL